MFNRILQLFNIFHLLKHAKSIPKPIQDMEENDHALLGLMPCVLICAIILFSKFSSGENSRPERTTIARLTNESKCSAARTLRLQENVPRRCLVFGLKSQVSGFGGRVREGGGEKGNGGNMIPATLTEIKSKRNMTTQKNEANRNTCKVSTPHHSRCWEQTNLS